MSNPLPGTPGSLVTLLELGWSVIEGSIEDMVSVVDLWWSRVKLALRNPFTFPIRFLDATLKLFTGLVGIVVRAPISGLRQTVLDALRANKLHNRIMTFESAVHLAFDSLSKWTNLMTFTDESGIIGILLQRMGRTLWHLRSRYKLVKLFIAAESESEIIAGLVKSYKGKFSRFKWIAGVFASLSLMGFLGAIALWGGFAFLLADREDLRQIGVLENDNPRRRRKKKVQTRTAPKT